MSKRLSFMDRVLAMNADADAKADAEEQAPTPTPALQEATTPPTSAGRHAGGFVGRVIREQNEGLADKIDHAEAEREKALAEKADALRKLAELKRELGDALRELDPTRIAPSPFERRLPISYMDRAFDALADDIKRTGSNIQPIIVRAYTGQETSRFDWEVIVGHRRRAACQRSECDVIAIVREATNEEVIRLMASENDVRESESALEMGLHYRRVMDEGVTTSERHLAELVGKSRSAVQRYLKLAEIPSDIRDAFRDPRDIRMEWAWPILNAMQKDGAAVRERLASIAASGSTPPALAVFRAITHTEASSGPEAITVDGRIVATVTTRPMRGTSIIFVKAAPAELIEATLEMIKAWSKDEGNTP